MKKTIIDLFESSVEKYNENNLLLEKTDTQFVATSYGEARIKAIRIGAGLASIGIKPKDTISILSEGRNAWVLSELGILYAGAISVPLSIKLEESGDLIFRLNHAEVSFILVSRTQLPKIRNIKNELPLLKKIIIFDEIENLEENEILLSEVEKSGVTYLEKNEKEFLAISQSLENDDYATITYTSGTTADPKGVILTHRNYTANVEQSLTCMSIPPSFRTLIILPLDHCFAHVVGFYIMIACGASFATVQVGRNGLETLKNIPVNIKEVKPNFLLSVPALAKNFRKNIESNIYAKGKFAKGLFKLALKTAYAYNKDGYLKGRGMSFLLKPFVLLFDRILFSKIREAFGGELEFFIGGGALLDTELQRFFYAIGIPMYQGYGLSEATPVISTNAPKKHRFGSSGILVQPMDLKILDENGIEQAIGEKGEIVVRGENVMAGYWKNPKATAETIRDGWLYTGDMGYMGKDGLLYVLGRFKSLLISSDGEKYSPEGMEEALSEKSPYIDQVILYNDQNPYVSALIVPNKEKIIQHFEHHRFHSDEERTTAYIKLLQDEIAKYKKHGIFAGEFPERWLPSTFALLGEPFTEQNGFVNSTMKIIRGKVEEFYNDRIKFMYTPEGKEVLNDQNRACFNFL